MKITTQRFIIPAIAVVLGISACSDKNKGDENREEKTPATTTTPASPLAGPEAITEGNWKVKADQLSTANAEDIKADLEQLNHVTDSANTKGSTLRDELQNAVQDPAKVQEIVAKTQKIQDEIQQEFLALNLKSSEVQNIRVQMLENLSTAKQLQGLSKQPGFNLAAPSEEFRHLSQNSIAQQQKISGELNQLTQKYQ